MRTTSKLAVLFSLVLGVGCAAPAEEVETEGSEGSALGAGGGLLALGDSIAYGWQPEWAPEQEGKPANPGNLQKAVLGKGYPEKAAALLGLRAANGSCPGEASGSFVSETEEDNGCRDKRADGLKMQTSWGKAKTQLEFARAFVEATPPKVITLTLGGNDLFLLQRSCEQSVVGATACIAGSATLGRTTTRYRENLEALLEGLFEAGYRGTVVMVTTYAMRYTTLSGEPLVFGAFNRALTGAVSNASKVTPGMKIVVADAYARFAEQAAATGNDACKAGLLIKTLNGAPILDDDRAPTCDRHPSPRGHEVIAAEIARVAR